MFIAFNIVVILLVGLIAYWWANQGLFSALLHLLCVIVAGAIALAFWEPLTIGLFLRGSFFDDYAWGMSLILLFSISLFVLRITMDRVAPGNVRVPHWASLSFGGALGACSGIISVGILLIGIGHVQSSSSLLGWSGWSRSTRTAEVQQRGEFWVPVQRITSEFYGMLSVTSLKTGQPLRHYAPRLYTNATLLRDTYGKGKGKFSLLPKAATIEGVKYVSESGGDRYYIDVSFGLDAQDFGEQLTLASSQLRLIGHPTTSKGSAPVVFPVAWRQYSGYHKFDNISHFISSQPGKESATAEIEFQTPPGFQPRFLQIRGTRFQLPTAEEAPAGYSPTSAARAAASAAAAPITGGQAIDGVIEVTNSIRPIMVSTNVLPAGIEERDKYLTKGIASFDKRGNRGGSRTLQIKGIYEPKGTWCVMLDVSRGGPADIYARMNELEDGAVLALLDDTGGTYTPIGYFHDHGSEITIQLEPQRHLKTISEIPILPTSGTESLRLIFYVTENVTLKGFRFGETDIGHCNVIVKGKKRR